MKAVWTASDAARATHGRAGGTWRASNVAIDSREVKGGELFVALKGERVDGHRFVEGALAHGAAAAMVSEGEGERLLTVADTQKALEDLGRAGRARSAAKIIGVTGSVGKTSTKEMLRDVLAAHGNTFASHGNFNNHIGTPLNLANLPQEARFAVFEMGMNHAGEIAALTSMVRPDIAVITGVEAVHLEFFKDEAAIADAKSEIFGSMQNGVAILNRDNAQFERCAAHAKARGLTLISFGRGNADCRLLSYRATLSGSEAEADIFGTCVPFSMKAIGAHWATTALIAFAVTHALKLDVHKTASALSNFAELPGRGRVEKIRIPGGEATLMDDSYNASPAAMRAAFAKLRELRAAGIRGRVIAALGDMRELGDSAPALHAALAADLEGIDAVFTAGPLMRHLHDALPPAQRAAHAADAAALLPVLRLALKQGDLVLVKGSHGSHMYDIANALIAGEGDKIPHAV